MAQAIFSIELTGFQQFAAILHPDSFQKHLKRNIRRATGKNAAYLAKQMRMTIRNKGANAGTQINLSSPSADVTMQQETIVANRPLTVALKKSSKPLVNKGDLFGSITYEMIDDYTAFAGVSRSSNNIELAYMLHKGVKINVTPEMRGMFMMLHYASRGSISPSKLTGRAAELWKMNQTWFPLKPSTTTITIPGRPFVKITLEDKATIRTMRVNWELALAKVFEDMRLEFERASR